MFCCKNESEIVVLISTTEDRIAYILEEYDLDDIDLEDLSEAILSEFKQSVIEYVCMLWWSLAVKLIVINCNIQLRA